MAEFGEKVFSFVPCKARAKLDHRWRLGMSVGLASNSDENCVALPNGNVIKSRSVARNVEEHRWDAAAVLKIRHLPIHLTPAGVESISPAIEESLAPHLDGDAAERQAAEDGFPAAEKRREKRLLTLR